jgi:ADP-heptose:LPS heptosyltransferase
MTSPLPGASPQPSRRRFSSNARRLLWIDRCVGVPVCLLLTAFRRLSDLFSGRPEPAIPARILFLKLAEQGSTVLAYGALQAAVSLVGRERVYFLAFEDNRFVVDIRGVIPEENVLTIRTDSPWGMMASCLSRLREIRRLGIDSCVDMEFFARSSAVIAFLSGSGRRVGFHSYFREGPYRGDLFTHRVLYNPHLHTSRTFTSLVRALEADPRKLPTFPVIPDAPAGLPAFRPEGAEVSAMRRLFRGMGAPEGARVVLLNANASDLLPLRKWDGRNYVDLARRLLAEFSDSCVGFTGTAEEAPEIEKLVREVGSPRCFCIAGRTTIRELLVAYGLAEVLVTNDSGPAHFAALTDIDVVSLFGPETPLLFGAPGPRSHPLWAGLACSPCVNAFNNRQTACRDNVCMKSITVDQVLAEVRPILDRRRCEGVHIGV